jgi:hypothetical protein
VVAPTSDETNAQRRRPQADFTTLRPVFVIPGGHEATRHSRDAITVQNEPATGSRTAGQFSKSLGPVFRQSEAGYENHRLRPQHTSARYHSTILDDTEGGLVRRWRGVPTYASGPSRALSKVHDAHPEKRRLLHRAVGGRKKASLILRWHVKNLIVGATRN